MPPSQKLLRIANMILLCILLAACAGAPTAAATKDEAVRVWIDLPLNDSQLAVAPVRILVHASGSQAITDVEYRVDDAIIAQVPASSRANDLLVDEQSWEAISAGSHLIHVRARDSSGSWSEAAEARIYLGEPVPITVPTETPGEPESTIAPVMDTSIFPPTFTPAVFNFLGSSCRQQSADIRVETEPAGSVYSVVVFLRFSDPDLDYDTGWDAGHSMTPEGNGVFRYTVTSEGFTRFADRINLQVRTQFIATDEQGIELARSPVYTDLLLTTTCAE
ncbi:MAG: hypothetical protein JXA97_09930 [Anaerolineales bacterium]|nr:hypothetical protein [Anaerolineales bacterium]